MFLAQTSSCCATTAKVANKPKKEKVVVVKKNEKEETKNKTTAFLLYLLKTVPGFIYNLRYLTGNLRFFAELFIIMKQNGKF